MTKSQTISWSQIRPYKTSKPHKRYYTIVNWSRSTQRMVMLNRSWWDRSASRRRDERRKIERTTWAVGCWCDEKYVGIVDLLLLSVNVLLAPRMSCCNHIILSAVFSVLTLLAGRQEGHPACKNWVVRYWRGYLSGARYKWFAYCPADATPIMSCSTKIQNGLPFWCWLTQVVLEKRPLNGWGGSSVAGLTFLVGWQEWRLALRPVKTRAGYAQRVCFAVIGERECRSQLVHLAGQWPFKCACMYCCCGHQIVTIVVADINFDLLMFAWTWLQ